MSHYRALSLTYYMRVKKLCSVKVDYGEYFEPYVVAVAEGFPRFNQHLLGRYFDKSSLLMEVYARR